ncbi:hypothetical protein BVX98_01635 [bacterium F11]|nr:hypothetical protein BVX98_01635 [bacterium F11]
MVDNDRKKQDLVFKKGKWWPISALILIPFMLIFLPLYKAARNLVNWKAVFFTVVTFEVVMFLAEAFSISRGHWVWNESRIFGYKIWGVPIEEPLLYYWFPPVFIITLFHFIRKKIEDKKKGTTS